MYALPARLKTGRLTAIDGDRFNRDLLKSQAKSLPSIIEAPKERK